MDTSRQRSRSCFAASSIGGMMYVELSPPSQQSGTINVSGTITSPELVPPTANLVLSGAAGSYGVFVNYNSSATNGLTVVDGGVTNSINFRPTAAGTIVTTNSNLPVTYDAAINSKNSGSAGGINPQWYNALDYGAKADGVTNDASALLSAITAAVSAGGGVVYLPKGATGTYFLEQVSFGTLTSSSTSALGTFPVLATSVALPYGHYYISDGTHTIQGSVTSGGGTTAPTLFITTTTGGTVAAGATITLIGISQRPSVSFIMEPSTQLLGNGQYFFASVWGFGGYNFAGERFEFGRISGFGSAGATSGGAFAFLDSTSFARVNVCELYNNYFNVFVLANAGGVFGHIITWVLMRAYVYGCYFDITQSSGGIQGLYCGGPGSGMLSNVQQQSYAIYLKAAGGTNTLLSSNVFEIPGINGNNDLAWGIVFDGANFTSNNVFKHVNSYGALATGRYLYCLNGATIANQYFELALYVSSGALITTTIATPYTIPAVGVTTATGFTSTAIVNTFQYYITDGTHAYLATAISGGGTLTVQMRTDAIYVNGTMAASARVTTALGGSYQDFSGFFGGQQPNVMKVTGSNLNSSMIAPTYYIANTSSNTRSTFNSGVPLFYKRIPVAMELPSLSAGGTADFYVYSPFTSGVQKQPKFQVQQMNTNAVLDVIEDESDVAGSDGQGPIANQVHIRIRAFGAVPANTYVFGVLEMMD